MHLILIEIIITIQVRVRNNAYLTSIFEGLLGAAMKKYTKLLSVLLALSLLLTAVACASNEESQSQTETGSVSDTESESESTESAFAMEGDEFGNAAVGEHGAVSSYNEISSRIGLDILQAGGNAVDAAVATSLAVGVVEPHHSGIGGSGLMTIYLAEENRYTTIEYLETIPGNVDGSYYLKSRDIEGPRAAGVPGQVAGLAMALEKYGTMSWQEILKPIIKLCREGFPIDEVAAGAMADGYEKFSQEGKEYLFELFTDEGFPYAEGDIFKNEDLANTFETLSKNGWQDFYTGEIAKKISDDFAANNAAMSMEDLANYYAAEREPLVTNYYGYDIVTIANPSVGGTLLVGALNIMQELGIKDLAQGSAEYWKVFNESVRLATNPAYTYSGDPAFYDMPSQILCSKEYAKDRAALFNPNAALDPLPDADLEYAKKETPSTKGKTIAVSPTKSPVVNDTEVVTTMLKGHSEKDTIDEGGNTTHLCVIDEKGNIVSTTNTIGLSWGCYHATPGLGFVYNTHLNNVSWSSASSPDYYADPGKKVRSTMSPTIVVKDGKPLMAVGSPGSTVIPPVVANVINNVLLYGMNVQQAINAPRAFVINRPYVDMSAEQGRMDSKTVRLLEVYGYVFRDTISDYDAICGGVAAMVIDRDTGKIYAGGDPRRDYKALAY